MAKAFSSDSIEIKAAPHSLAVKVEGEPAARLTDTLVKVISPFTTGLGWLDDQLTVARRRAAIRAAVKASEQLKAEGITSAKIPPKILLPWLEGASLETDEIESLTDAWAGLFVRAAKSSDAVIISYIDTLKKLGKEEAKLLEFFATDTAPFFSQKFYEREQPAEIFSDTNPLRKNALRILAKCLKQEDKAGLHEFMEQWGIQGMCQIIFYSAPGIRMRQTEFFKKHEHAVANLEHLDLVAVKSKAIRTSVGNIEIIWFEITKYAFDLVWACNGTVTGHAAYRREDFVSAADVVREMKDADDAT